MATRSAKSVFCRSTSRCSCPGWQGMDPALDGVHEVVRAEQVALLMYPAVSIRDVLSLPQALTIDMGTQPLTPHSLYGGPGEKDNPTTAGAR